MRYGQDAELTPEMVNDSTDGFSPCPGPIVDLLKTWVIPSRSGGTLFDNCAGDGVAAHSLAQAWGLRPVLVEPHADRHALCLRYDSNAVRAPAQHVAGRGPTVWFFNPPYDRADETGSVERHLLRSATASVPAPLTLCIWLMPQRLLSDPFFSELVNLHLDGVRAFQFPAAWERYGQAAIMGYWVDRPPYRTAASGPGSHMIPSDLPPLEPADRPYSLNAVGVDFRVWEHKD